MYLYQLKTKFANLDNQEFDYRRMKCRQIGYFWLFFGIYSIYWGSFYYVSLDKRNLSYVDFAVSFYFGVLIILYLVLGVGLIKQI